MMQPKNKKIVGATLTWSNTFGQDMTSRFSAAQKFVDSEMLRLMSPYTPFRTGVMEKSATLGTKIGSGQIVYVSPGARYQYYGKLMVSSLTGSAYAKQGESKVLTGKNLSYSKAQHPLARAKWFELVKTKHGKAVLRGAAAIVGGKTR